MNGFGDCAHRTGSCHRGRSMWELGIVQRHGELNKKRASQLTGPYMSLTEPISSLETEYSPEQLHSFPESLSGEDHP